MEYDPLAVIPRTDVEDVTRKGRGHGAPAVLGGVTRLQDSIVIARDRRAVLVEHSRILRERGGQWVFQRRCMQSAPGFVRQADRCPRQSFLQPFLPTSPRTPPIAPCPPP